MGFFDFVVSDEEQFLNEFLSMGENEFCMFLNLFLPASASIIGIEYDETKINVQFLVCFGAASIEIEVETELDHESMPIDYLQRVVGNCQAKINDALFDLMV